MMWLYQPLETGGAQEQAGAAGGAIGTGSDGLNLSIAVMITLFALLLNQPADYWAHYMLLMAGNLG